MPEQVAYQLYGLFWGGLDWLYPPQCGGCGGLGSRWCVQCAASLELIKVPVCTVCGQAQPEEQVCFACRKKPPAWNRLRSLARYGGALRHAIHGLKYRRDMGLGEALAKPLIELYRALDWRADMVVPVPLDLARMRERGYNQISLLGLPLALACGMPFRRNALMKVKETPRQVTLTAELRRMNLADAFEADPSQVKGKTILLIDDVITTGTTLDACSRALRVAGAAQILALTLARAGFYKNEAGLELNDDSWDNQ